METLKPADTKFPPLHKPRPGEVIEITAENASWEHPVPFASSIYGPEPPRFIDRLGSEQRKQFPMASGVLDYAPDALAAVSHISWLGNEKHNPGEPLHHARGKSMDHADCIIRHLSTRHQPDPAYADDQLAPVFHLAEAAWRCLMLLQEEMEKAYGLGLPPGAKEE